MNLAPRERIYMADKTVCRWFDSTLPTNIINFKIMEQTFKDRIYNKLVNSILDDINCYPYSNPSPYGEFFPFVDKNKWCEYRISCNLIEDHEWICYDSIIGYYQLEITELKVNVSIWSDKENDVKYIPLNINITKLSNMLNKMLYEKSWDIVEDSGPFYCSRQDYIKSIITGGNSNW